MLGNSFYQLKNKIGTRYLLLNNVKIFKKNLFFFKLSLKKNPTARYTLFSKINCLK